MNAPALLNHLRHEGYTLRTDGEKVYLGPRERVTPEVCDQVLAVKPDLLQLLASEWNGEKALELLAATMRRLGPPPGGTDFTGGRQNRDRRAVVLRVRLFPVEPRNTHGTSNHAASRPGSGG